MGRRQGARPLSPTERRETPSAMPRPGGPWPDLSAYARQPARGPCAGEMGLAGSKILGLCCPILRLCWSSLGLLPHLEAMLVQLGAMLAHLGAMLACLGA